MLTFITLQKILRKVKSTDFKVPKTNSPWYILRVLSISWSYRCKKCTTSTSSSLVKIFVKKIIVSIIIPSRQMDIPVLKYKLEMIPMWVIRNSNVLEKLKNESNNPDILIELWNFNSRRIKKEIPAMCVWLRGKF